MPKPWMSYDAMCLTVFYGIMVPAGLWLEFGHLLNPPKLTRKSSQGAKKSLSSSIPSARLTSPGIVTTHAALAPVGSESRTVSTTTSLTRARSGRLSRTSSNTSALSDASTPLLPTESPSAASSPSNSPRQLVSKAHEQSARRPRRSRSQVAQD